MLRPDGKLEDLGDFSDFYIQPSSQMDKGEKRELQELQDEVDTLLPTYILSL